MTKRVYPGRYAQAVFEIASARNELDNWQSDLRTIARLGEDAALIAWLESPKFPFADKVRVLTERLGNISPLALNLAYLLVAKGKLSLTGEIADEYQQLLDSYRGIESVEVTTAVSLGNEDKQRLSQRLSALLGKKVLLKSKVDPELIGGIVARVGGKLLDGSTRSQLLALKRAMER